MLSGYISYVCCDLVRTCVVESFSQLLLNKPCDNVSDAIPNFLSASGTVFTTLVIRTKPIDTVVECSVSEFFIVSPYLSQYNQLSARSG